jgi:hypothetical protein
MKRLCLVGLGLVCSLAAAKAESPTVAHSKTVRAHAIKTTTVRVAASSGLGSVGFSDPYAPPVGAQKAAISQFPPIEADSPVEPKSSFGIRVGRDAPGEPMTGGFGLRF